MDHWLQKWVMLGKDLCLKERWGMGEGGGSQRRELAVGGVGGGVSVCVCVGACVFVCVKLPSVPSLVSLPCFVWLTLNTLFLSKLSLGKCISKGSTVASMR